MPFAPSLLLAAALTLAWVPQIAHTTASLRGLSVASPEIVWASGTAGTFLRTTDAGVTWKASQVPGTESLDFRDIEAFDGQNALLLAAGPGASSRVYKTTDAGAHWSLTLQNPDSTGFFDCFAFWDHAHGILLGDPVDGHFTLFVTANGGTTWTRATQPLSQKDEGAFAASGTCIAVQGRHNAWFATGGINVSRVFYSADRGQTWSVTSAPLAAPAASAGIFSISFADSRHGFAVGGDYRKPTDSARTLALTKDGGKNWFAGAIPGGYRSAILRVARPLNLLLSVGSSGSDFSSDNGHTWQSFDTGNFNTVAGVSSGIWAAGPKGALAKLSLKIK